MKKIPTLILTSVVLASLICFVGCGTDAEQNNGASVQGINQAEPDSASTYTNEEAGFSVTLSNEWVPFSEEDLEALGVDSAYPMNYYYESTNEIIECLAEAGYGGMSITDLSKDDEAAIYSSVIALEGVNEINLNSGTYYQVEGTDTNGETYWVIYETIENGYLIVYEYISFGGESNTPHLNDFEDMVANAEYS